MQSLKVTEMGSVQINHDDCVRVYMISMRLEENRGMFQQLAKECLSRHHLDDPSFSLKHIFQIVAFLFNNKKTFLDLPNDAYGIKGIFEIDSNDFSRIRITRGCKLIYNVDVFH